MHSKTYAHSYKYVWWISHHHARVPLMTTTSMVWILWILGRLSSICARNVSTEPILSSFGRSHNFYLIQQIYFWFVHISLIIPHTNYSSIWPSHPLNPYHRSGNFFNLVWHWISNSHSPPLILCCCICFRWSIFVHLHLRDYYICFPHLDLVA
jgi:hypothetical protein